MLINTQQTIDLNMHTKFINAFIILVPMYNDIHYLWGQVETRGSLHEYYIYIYCLPPLASKNVYLFIVHVVAVWDSIKYPYNYL